MFVLSTVILYTENRHYVRHRQLPVCHRNCFSFVTWL